MRTPTWLAAVVALTGAGPVVAPVRAAAADPEPAAFAAFQAERAEAAGAFDPADLAAADEAAGRATAALAAGEAEAAGRAIRDARWLVPVAPADRPAHVTRVLGGGRPRHADRINALAYTPDGAKLVTASRDGTARVWDAANGRQLVAYTGHADDGPAVERPDVFRVAAVAVHPDGKTVASAGGTQVHLWDVATGARTRTIPMTTGPTRGLAFGRDGKLLVTAGDDKRVTVWDAATGEKLFQLPEQAARIEALAVGRDGAVAATVNAKGELTVYPVGPDGRPQAAGVVAAAAEVAGLAVAFAPGLPGVLVGRADGLVALVRTDAPDPAAAGPREVFAGHAGRVTCLAARADGPRGRFASGSADGTVRVWDPATRETVYRFQAGPGAAPGVGLADAADGGVTAVALSPDGRTVAAGTADGTLRVFALAPDDARKPLTDATAELWAVAVSPAGTHFAAAGADKVVRVYTAGGKLDQTLTGHTAAVPAVAFVTETTLVTGGGDRKVKLWTLPAGTATDVATAAGAVLAVAADPGTGRFAAGGSDKAVTVFDPAGKPAGTWAGPSIVTALALAGGRLAVGSADGAVTVLDVTRPTPKVESVTVAHTGGVTAVAFGRAGTTLLTAGGDGAARTFGVTPAGTLTPAARLDPPGRPGGGAPPVLSAAAFSPDAAKVAVGGADGVVRVFDATLTAELLAPGGRAGWVTGVAFTADGRSVVAAGVDKAVRRFDIPRPPVVSGHAGAVRAVAVSPDGKRVATASADRTARVWDRATGRTVATLTGSPAGLGAVAFAGNGVVVTGGDDGVARWWDIKTAAETRTEVVDGRPFALAADDPSGRVAVVWGRPEAKRFGTDVFGRDPAEGKARLGLSAGADVSSVAVAPDGRLEVRAVGGRVTCTRPGEAAATPLDLFPAPVADLGFAPDGTAFVAIDGTTSARVVAADPPAPAAVLAVGPATGVAVGPGGKTFATLGPTGAVKLFDAAGKVLRTWPLKTPATGAVFTPDGTAIITGHPDGTAAVLAVP